MQLAGDDAEAKALVSSIASRAGFTPVDVGPLRTEPGQGLSRAMSLDGLRCLVVGGSSWSA